MKPYRAVLSARFRVLLQYRAAAIAGFGTQLFWGLIRMMIFGAFYSSARGDQPMSYPEVVTYIWLGQAMFALLPMRADSDVAQMMRDGTVAYELLRPVDLYSLWFARAVAARTAPTLLRSVPMLLLAGLFLGLQPPASLDSAVIWLVSMGLAVALSAAFSTLITIAVLWTIAGEGIGQMCTGLMFLLCGLVIPLPLAPEFLQFWINLFPFRGLMDVPFRLYLGHIAPGDAMPVLVHQAVWIMALVIAGRMLLSRGTRRMVIQGG